MEHITPIPKTLPHRRTVLCSKMNKILNTAHGHLSLSTAKLGDNVLGSVHPSVCRSVRPSVHPAIRPSVNALTAEPFEKSDNPNYQSKVFVCDQWADNHADVLDSIGF